MTTAFVLGINMSVAGIFAVAFAVVAAINPTARGAWWLALGYGTGIIYVGLEFILAWQVDPTPVGIGIFLTFLLALSFALVGVALHYRALPPWRAMAAIWALTILAVPVIFSLTYGSTPRLALYQLPYVAMQALLGLVIWRSGRRQPLDLLLIALQAIAAAIYVAKPFIAAVIGTASAPQGYMATTYAAISQSGSVVTLMAIALVLLLVMMRDSTAEMIAHSETDTLSGVLNRRGFEHHAELALLRGGDAAVLVAADLDHFKTINDSFGHAAGDGVIAHFAAILADAAPSGAIVGRIGGEEFAVLIPGGLLPEGRAYAETVRAAFAAAQMPALGIDRGVTASFGVAQRSVDDRLFELSRRADAALYRAKSGGRNRVRVALGEFSSVPAVGAA
ncbi:diguanylate cyclase [Sphingopyxis sp. JAI128]|uniref:GGDEF domain-containing protein n=1 Tax=Sphingopyxis sp. JAI128 TaxID=2723066 RepID=UPI00161E54A0|nr:GGDEF domain-containing protein [Sphingopyxis sp. JAI128]MBB6427438.1 diguanylate cyclase (GGDEF)-like protein [Sphingopyxis sp. JAI128]